MMLYIEDVEDNFGLAYLKSTYVCLNVDLSHQWINVSQCLLIEFAQ